MLATYLVVLPVMTIFYLYAITFSNRGVRRFAMTGAAIAYPMASWFSEGDVPMFNIVSAGASGLLAGLAFWFIAEYGYEETSAAP